MQQTKSQSPAFEDQELDASSLAAIRSVLTSQEEKGAKPAGKVMPKRRQRDRIEPGRRRDAPASADTPKVAAPAAEQIDDTPPPSRERRASTGRFKGYRPTPKHILILSILILVAFRPWLVLGLLMLSAFVMVGVFLILGYDGFWRRIMSGARWYARRRPARAAELQRKLDHFAMKWDAVLDRFPEGTVDGLYLPDFGHLAEADARHDAALDRRFEDLRQTRG